jgi:hypothetical protein
VSVLLDVAFSVVFGLVLVFGLVVVFVFGVDVFGFAGNDKPPFQDSIQRIAHS